MNGSKSNLAGYRPIRAFSSLCLGIFLVFAVVPATAEARAMPDGFADLKNFYADAVVRNNMYVLAGNKLYHFRRNQ